MELHPRYGAEPVIVLDVPPAVVAEPAIRQRRRLAEVLAGFDDEAWSHPSRCEGWTNRDVLVHLESTNGFWGFSVAAARKGEPTRFLEHFDPVADPAALVAGSAQAAEEVLASFVASTERLAALLDRLDEAAWIAPAEAPVGHISVSAVVHHALWDAWVHERDVLLPLGIEPQRHDDEIAAVLRYAAALGPAIGVNGGRPPTGTFVIDAVAPDLRLAVEVDRGVLVRDARPGDPEPLLVGDAAALADALSLRGPFPSPLPDAERWRLGALADVFEQG